MGNTTTATEAQAIPWFDGEVKAVYGAGNQHMLFRCRIFEHKSTVLLFTELDERNPGWSITNGIEYAIRTVMERWPNLPLSQLVVIEHYDDREKQSQGQAPRCSTEIRDGGETFDFVQANYSWPDFAAAFDQRRDLDVKWKPVTKQEVESFIGGRLP